MRSVLLFFAIIISWGLSAQVVFTTACVIVKLKTNQALGENAGNRAVNNKIDLISKNLHASKIEKIYSGSSGNQLYKIEFSSPQISKQAILEYQAMDEVEYAEEDFIGNSAGSVAPNDPGFSNQWALNNDGTFSSSKAGADIKMEQAWGIEQGDSSIIVAIIDGGCKMDHPELAGRIWRNEKEIPNNGIDDDSNSLIDDVRGWDFVTSDGDPSDEMGHGTNVTGIIGATGNNSFGYAGMDWNCKLMILRGTDQTGSGYYSWWTSAIYYAVDHGARVINMSLGGTSNSSTLSAAVNYALNKKVTIVACMMNTNNSVTYYPAGFAGVIAVGATNPDDTRANPFFWSSTSGSNYGSHISVVAPGNYIYGLDYQSNTSTWNYWGGTSQATPHVTGLASLLLAQNPSRTPAQIKTIIESTAEDQVGNLTEDTKGWDQYYGSGRINAFKALSYSLSTGIDESHITEEINLFPNPSTGSINLILSSAPQNPLPYQIVNELGQAVLAGRLSDRSTKINYELTPGVYFALINMAGRIERKKIVVAHQ